MFTGLIGPSFPDNRDYDNRHRAILPLANKIGANTLIKQEDLPKEVDLSNLCSPIEDQGSLGSCTAHAGVGLLEYMARRAHGSHVDLSRMFLYYVTRRLLGWTGDTGAYLRTTMAAIRMLGACPEKYWKYDKAALDIEPSNIAFALAQQYQGVTYLRHDAGVKTPPDCALLSMKIYLAAGIPSMLGFYGFDSFASVIPLPGPTESAKWAHAVDIVGYSDETKMLKFRNSWGVNWGFAGYGFMPYEYCIRYAWDMWSLLSAEWIDTGEFGL